MNSPRLVCTLALLSAGAMAQQRTVSGTVVDANTSQPIPDTAVLVVGTDVAARSAKDGAFTLPGAPAGALTLHAAAEGFKAVDVPVAADQDQVRIALEPELREGIVPSPQTRRATAEEEMVVTGRASRTERRNVAVSVAKVKGEQLTQVPAETVDLALQGKVAGANIQRNDGAPGGGAQVRLRGVSSINATAEPLFILDGMIVSNVAIPNNISVVTLSRLGSNTSPNQDSLVNRIADFNTEDIESIEVLKGAAAAAIYGSKASNGVVILTTKKGQPGSPRVDFTQRFGESFLAKKLGARTFTNADDAAAAFGSVARQYCCSGPTYDHDSDMAGRHDLATESILSVSGGGEGGLRYYLSGSVKSDPGIIQNTGYQKQSVRLNLGRDLGDLVTVNVNSYLIHSVASRGITNNDNSNTSFYIVLPFLPNFYNLRPANGVYPHDPFISNDNNPLQTAALMKNDEGVWRFLSAMDATVKLLRTDTQQLNLVANGGVDRFQQENELLFPPSLYWAPSFGLPGTSLFGTVNNLNYNLGLNLVHTWSPQGGDSFATTSAGLQYESRDLNLVRVVGRNLVGGQPNLDAATTVSVGQQREQVHDRGGYLQEEVILLERKLALTAALRGDSSSTNGNPNTFYFYPKASASYRFYAPAASVDDLKLRLAYGETGNQPLYGQRFTGLSVSTNVNGNPALGVTGIAGDPNIKPERAREIEAGTDISLLEGRAVIELNLYQRTISDMLLQRSIAPTSGFTTQFFNGGTLRNRGVEIMVEATPVQFGSLRWQTAVGFAKNVSLITSLPVPAYNYTDFGTV